MNHTSAESAGNGDPNQYVTFTLGDGEYGIEILNVQEFKGYGAVTPVPNMPRHLRGVMNLRGVIIPVFDLRVRLGLEATLNDFTVIVVAVVKNRTVGLVVDTVSDVIDIPPTDIQDTPEFSARTPTAFLRGMARMNERLVILLDLNQLVTIDAEPAVAAN
ncbi:MAG: cheW 6 [Myxococcaceae bacterium]|nr:cheW 6 [Myxococcaceae bacterium]